MFYFSRSTLQSVIFDELAISNTCFLKLWLALNFSIGTCNENRPLAGENAFLLLTFWQLEPHSMCNVILCYLKKKKKKEQKTNSSQTIQIRYIWTNLISIYIETFVYENRPSHWASGSGLHGPGNWPACELAEQSSLALAYSAGNSAWSQHWPPWTSQQPAPDWHKERKSQVWITFNKSVASSQEPFQEVCMTWSLCWE